LIKINYFDTNYIIYQFLNIFIIQYYIIGTYSKVFMYIYSTGDTNTILLEKIIKLNYFISMYCIMRTNYPLQKHFINLK